MMITQMIIVSVLILDVRVQNPPRYITIDWPEGERNCEIAAAHFNSNNKTSDNRPVAYCVTTRV